MRTQMSKAMQCSSPSAKDGRTCYNLQEQVCNQNPQKSVNFLRTGSLRKFVLMGMNHLTTTNKKNAFDLKQ